MSKTGSRLAEAVGTRARLVLAACLVAATMAACGTATKPTPARAVSDSLSKLGSQSGISLRLSVLLTPSQIEQLSSLMGGKAVSSKETSALASTAFFLDVQSGGGEALDSTQFQTDKNNRVDVGITVGNDTPVEIRYVEQTLYARADVAAISGALGKGGSSTATSFRASLAGAAKFVPGLDALGQGRWVSISRASLQPILSLLKQLGSSAGNGAAGLATKLIGDLRTSLQANSTYVDDGVHNGLTEYTDTLDVQGFVKQFGSDLKTDVGSIPIPGASSLSGGLSRVESGIPKGQKAVFQVWVNGNKAQEIDLDLRQFDSKLPFAVPMRLLIGEPSAISAPGSSTPLDLSKLPQLIARLLGGGGRSSSSGG
jgi:hypothetical protein